MYNGVKSVVDRRQGLMDENVGMIRSLENVSDKLGMIVV